MIHDVLPLHPSCIMDRKLATSQSQGLNKMEQLRELVLDKNRVKQFLGSAVIHGLLGCPLMVSCSYETKTGFSWGFSDHSYGENISHS